MALLLDLSFNYFLGKFVDCEEENRVIEFHNRCQDMHGGYGGGPRQMSHLPMTLMQRPVRVQ